MTWAGNRNKRSGQAIIFLMMVMVILLFVVLWNYDLHKIVYVKSTTQNAGDSAALVAARWQGVTLNLIGDLNLMHALALSVRNNVAPANIPNIQARLCYVGPMIGFMAAQQAAKLNRTYGNPDFDALLRERASTVLNYYTTAIGPDGQMLFPEPYAGCWYEYGHMLSLIANDGVAAGPDNAHFYTDYTGGHILLTIGFYQAIASRDWCWFYNNEPDLLRDYENFFPRWWDPLPPIGNVEYMNSEIFGLGLTKKVTRLSSFTDVQTIASLVQDRHLSPPSLSFRGMTIKTTWYCYNDVTWSSWAALAPTNNFPVAGPVKTQYDYAGADAVVRIEAKTSRVTPGARGSTINKTIVWTAAAKPFGYLNDEQDRPNALHIVLPAFHNVRLIPIETSSAPSGGSFNLAWRHHIEDHLPDYMQNGPTHSSCWYCQQLQTWENSQFRQSGITWLSANSWQCTVTAGGGGGGAGGGTSVGH
jgi:hypothetical protein